MPSNRYQEKLAELSRTQEEAQNLIVQLQEAVNNLDQVNTKSAELRTEVSQLTTAKTTANAQISAINTFHAQLTSVKTQIDNQLADAKSENSKIVENIAQYEEGYAELVSKLDGQKQRADELMKSAEETLNLATSTALSKDFGERANRVAKSRRAWAALVIVYLLLSGTAIVLLSNGKDIGIEDLWNIKSIVLVPFIYLLYFLIRQFHRSRDLEEKYTFKSLMSKTLENYVKLLKDEFGEDSKEKRLSFAIKTMENIYSNPIKQTFTSIWLESRLAKFGVREESLSDNSIEKEGATK